MPIYTKKEFAQLIGKTTKDLAVYIGRGKVNLTNDGKIDTSDLKNANFYQVYSAKSELKAEAPPVIRRPKKVIIEDEEIPEPDFAFDSDIPAYAVSEQKLKYLDTLKREKEIEALELKNQKIKGEVVPADLIQPILLQQNRNMMIEIKNGMEEVLRSVAKRFDLTLADVADYRKQITYTINDSAKKAIENSKKALVSILNDYSETRGRGEKIN